MGGSRLTDLHGDADALSYAYPSIFDCNGDGLVAVNEIVTGVSIALGSAPADSCPAIRAGAGPVTVDQLIRAIASSLNGCPPTS